MSCPGSKIKTLTPTFSAMNQKDVKDDFTVEIERRHFARAALLAASAGLPENEILDFRRKALWQMSAIYRNAPGTMSLTQQYGISKPELKQILEQYAEEQRKNGNNKDLEHCYDHSTGKYLTFEAWLDLFFKNWEKFDVS